MPLAATPGPPERQTIGLPGWEADDFKQMNAI